MGNPTDVPSLEHIPGPHPAAATMPRCTSLGLLLNPNILAWKHLLNWSFRYLLKEVSLPGCDLQACGLFLGWLSLTDHFRRKPCTHLSAD